MSEIPLLVAFTGLAGAGKSTAARHLAAAHGFVRTRFAAPLKAMLRGYLTHIGTRPDLIERMIEGDLKEVPADEFSGQTPRFVMQTLGTEWGRYIIAPAFWTNAWTAQVVRLVRAGQRRVTVEDCRFANEVEAVRALGGLVVRIDARHPGLRAGAAGHASEHQDVVADLTLRNDGPPERFCARLDDLVKRYVRAA